MKYSRTLLITIVAAVVLANGVALAHEMTVQGTVVAVESARVQIKTGKEKAGAAPEWYPIDATTKIKRGTKSVTFAEAKIAVNERIVAIVDHPTKGPMTTKEIRLAAKTAAGGTDAR
jgi:hypothetical protein